MDVTDSFHYGLRPMQKSDFHFELPEALIAQRPPKRRGQSQLLVSPQHGAPQIIDFADIVGEFQGNEIIVVNDTRVTPARVVGQKSTGGAVEVFVLEAMEDGCIRALIRGKRLKSGQKVHLPNAEAEIIDRGEDGIATLRLDGVANLWAWLERVGNVPLPPYIRREVEPEDRERYQTVFASEPGAVAAPTAGLHFTQPIIEQLVSKGVTVCTVTLHVGLGTFMPMRVDNVLDHVMHEERYTIPESTQRHLESGRPIVAVGTTVVRALESYALNPSASRTNLFIYPGFEFTVVDGLITNFHLPESTLLMMVSAFAGRSRILELYKTAVDAEMKFFSYGDAMLLRRGNGRWT